MEKVESWRISTVRSISEDHQGIAFHIGALTEEKFRVYALKGFLRDQESLTGHIQLREDIFAPSGL